MLDGDTETIGCIPGILGDDVPLFSGSIFTNYLFFSKNMHLYIL